MTVRAVWKGYLKFGQLTVPVSLFTAVSTSERISLKLVSASDTHSVKRTFVDSETGENVERDQQIKGYEVAKGKYVTIEQQELDELSAKSDKTLHVEGFVSNSGVDELFLGKAYFMAPQDAAAQSAYALFREALADTSTLAIARATLFRRARTVALTFHERGIIAELLRYNYEVRSAKSQFSEVGSPKITKEMLSLAEHIISQKQGEFDPAKFEDRYEAALAELVKAKMAGKKLRVATPARPSKVVNLLDALRRSAEGSMSKLAAKSARSPTKKSPKSSGAKRRKASANTAKSAVNRKAS